MSSLGSRWTIPVASLMTSFSRRGFIVQTNTHRQTHRQRDRQTGRQTERQTDRQRDRQTGRQAGRQTHRQTDRQTGRQADRHTDRQRDRQTHMNALLSLAWVIIITITTTIRIRSESECKCLTSNQKPTGSQFSLLHEPNYATSKSESDCYLAAPAAEACDAMQWWAANAHY